MNNPPALRRWFLAAACVLLAAPTSASAAHIEAHDRGLFFDAGEGEANHVVVTRAGDGVDITDSAGLDVGRGCDATGSDNTSAHCDGPIIGVNAGLRDGDDYFKIDASNLASWVDGSSGDDTLIGGGDKDMFLGAEGDDTLYGGGGSDDLNGGLGDDHITGGPGWDTLYGKEGNDSLNSEDPVPVSDAPWYLQPMPATDDDFCGPGTDVATSDDYDGELACERIEYPGGRVVTPAYTAGPNGPWEDAAALTTTDEYGGQPTYLSLTPGGEAVAAWTRYNHSTYAEETRSAAKRHGEPLTAVTSSECCVIGLASDDRGNTVMLTRTDSSELHASVRPPDGDFGPPVTLGLSAWDAKLISNPQGDIAVIADGQAAIRSRGSSSFGEPVSTGAEGSVRAAALSGDGALITAWDGSSSGDADAPYARLFASVRKSDGTIQPPQAISSGRHEVESPELATDAKGDAALVWNEPRLIYSDQVTPSPYSVSDTNLISERLAGGDFSAPAIVPGAAKESYDAKVAMSGDGLVTVAFPTWNYVGRVASAQVGQALKPLQSFGLNMIPTSAELASNAAGQVLLTWFPDGDHAVTTFRDGTGKFGRVEDLRPGCQYSWSAMTRLNEGGEGAALIHDHGILYLATETDPAVIGHQECTMSAVYTDDPDANVYGDGQAQRTRIHPPDVTQFRIARLAARAKAADQTVYAAVDCPGHCDFRLTASRRTGGGRVVATASRHVVSKRRNVRASVRLRALPGAKAARPTKKVFVRVEGRDRAGRPVTLAKRVTVNR